jgi:CRISPR-associated protein Csx10
MAVDPEARALFLDGTVCFLNAYPSPGETRLLPRPLSWMVEKDQADDSSAPLYDLAIDPQAAIEQPKPPRSGDYVRLSPPEPRDQPSLDALGTLPTAMLYSPRQQGDVHIALNAPNVRTDENAVYRYDAIAAGECFAGAIVAPDDAPLDRLAPLIAQGTELYLGGAHSAGYGRVRVEAAGMVEGWSEYLPSDQDAAGLVVVTLLSDAILRGPHGQVDADMDGALARLLGLQALTPLWRYRRTRLVGGYNRKWGLPLPQSWALAAGSAFVYDADRMDADRVDAGRLRALVACGIGERRAEGFGRVAVNWHVWPKIAQGPVPRLSRLPVSLSSPSLALAERMAERRLRLELERGLIAAVADARISRPPQNTQLSRVRNAAQRALHTESLAPIADHLANLKGAKEQLRSARIDGESLLDWLETRVKEQDVEKTVLQRSRLPRLAGVEAKLTPALQALYTARLIDGVMKKAIRQNQEEGA